MRDVSNRDVSTSILGERIAFPIAISPTGLHCMAHPDGERGTAKGKFTQRYFLALNLNLHTAQRTRFVSFVLKTGKVHFGSQILEILERLICITVFISV